MNKTKTDHSIRPANAEDSARRAVLGAHVWVHTYATSGVSDVIAQYVMTTFTPETFRSLSSDPDIVLLVAEADVNLAGYIVMRFGSYHADVPIEIKTLYVQSAFAGRGIGSALLAHARGVAMARTGHRAIWLTVNARNQNAISFWHACGMTQDGITYFELGGVKHENKVMVARD
ncbi:N-acetyltransferase family protein [Burkholderia stagnalis]